MDGASAASTATPGTTSDPVVDPAPVSGPATLGCFPEHSPESTIGFVNGAGESSLVVADFTGDGFDDVLIQRWRFQTADEFPIVVLVNDGRGALTEATEQAVTGPIPETVFVGAGREVIADLNGDRAPDVFLPDFGKDADPFPGAQNVLLLSTGDGNLVDASDRLPQRRDTTHSAAAGDVDGDGDLDLFVGDIWGGPMIGPHILINDGSGTFVDSPHPLPFLTDLTQNGFTVGAFVDVDIDGDDDLILGDAGDDIANEESSRLSVILLNDGAGRFSHLQEALPPGPFDSTPFQIALHIEGTDLDDDGYPDLVINHTKDYVGRMIQILINDGGGRFRDETQVRLPQRDNGLPWYRRVEMMDVDRDGDPDIVARPLDANRPDLLVFLNRGGGFFEPEPERIDVGWLYYEFIDGDGDGGLDLVFSEYSFRAPERIGILRDVGCREQ